MNLQQGISTGCTRCPYCHAVRRDEEIVDHIERGCDVRRARLRAELSDGDPDDAERIDRLIHSLGVMGWSNSERALRRLRRHFHRELASVAKFMDDNEQARRATPGVPSEATVRLALKLIDEEIVEELRGALRYKALPLAALDRNDPDVVVEVADGIVDSIYILLWIACAFGLQDSLHRVWRKVEAKNASKAGAPKDPETGKVLRPEGYEPPDIHGAVYVEED
jgi:hypothetical protein